VCDDLSYLDSAEGVVVFVGTLPWSVTIETLTDLFRDYNPLDVLSRQIWRGGAGREGEREGGRITQYMCKTPAPLLTYLPSLPPSLPPSLQTYRGFAPLKIADSEVAGLAMTNLNGYQLQDRLTHPPSLPPSLLLLTGALRWSSLLNLRWRVWRLTNLNGYQLQARLTHPPSLPPSFISQP